MTYSKFNISAVENGFSLVDLMVGMVVGLLTVLVIMQSYSAFEGQKRTTTSGVTAQENGLVALHTMESDIRMAGAGLITNGMFSCTKVNKYLNGAVTLNQSLAPVTITDGGASGAPDTVSVVYSDSACSGGPMRIQVAMPTPSNVITVNQASCVNSTASSQNAYQGDIVLLSTPGSGNSCTIMQATGRPQTQANGVNILTSSGQSNYNPPGGFNGTLFPPGGYTTTPQSYVQNMGSLVNNQYQVLCNTLTVTDLKTQGAPSCTYNPVTFTNATGLVNNVVNIQAQYGIAPTTPPRSQSVNCWVNATGANTNTCDGNDWQNPSAADIARIKAIRLAIVVRSSLPEKPDSSGVCSATPSTTAPNYPRSWPGGPSIDVTNLPSWQCYRYKVYQTIIPLRNVIWANL